MRLQFDEVRRLTGPNLLWDKPGALVDVLFDDVDALKVAECWLKWVTDLLENFGWGDQQGMYRLHAEGASLAISAPIDALYTACDIAELAWYCCEAELLQTDLPDWQAKLTALQHELTLEQSPRMRELHAAAARENVICLVDDDVLSLGTGARSESWPNTDLPSSEEINWAQYSAIPTAYVTGTNGKSTSVRLAAEIAKHAGLKAGITSTDFIRVGETVIDYGDYSGPGGARLVLRNKDADLAFLEVARGGLLRRGLPVERVNTALITNVASDHLGQYGINTVEELAQTKFMVAKALSAKDVLVLNADDPLSVEKSDSIDTPICWFSPNEQNALIQAQLMHGQRAVFVRGNRFIYHHEGNVEELCELDAAPMTFNATAHHNIQNALGVIGLCKAMGLSSSAIEAGLMSFGSDADDNPGRGNVYDIAGVTVVVDFAHNEHSMRAMVNMVKQMPANRRIVMFGHAGDRSDKDIESLTLAVADLEAHTYVISELEKYLRGRQLGEIPTMIKTTLSRLQISNERVIVASSAFEGARLAIDAAIEGDIVLLFVLDDRTKIHEWLMSIS